MKYEPLDLEEISKDARKSLDFDEAKWVEYTLEFVKQRLKSTVGGLLADIDAELKRTKKDMVQYLIDNDFSGQAFSSGYRTALKDVEEIIKKWFPDVLKEGERK